MHPESRKEDERNSPGTSVPYTSGLVVTRTTSGRVMTAQRHDWKGIDEPPRRSVLAADRIESPHDGSALAAPLATERRTPQPSSAATLAGLVWKRSDRREKVVWIPRTATWPTTDDGHGVRRFGAGATAPRQLLPILCGSQVAIHGLSADAALHCPSRLRLPGECREIPAPAHPDRVNDADLGRRLAAWQARCLQSWRSWMSARSNCEGPHHRQQQIRYRRICAGERQVLVIKVEPNSFGRQLLDNATEIRRW